jgi:FkbM family methyltransferase
MLRKALRAAGWWLAHGATLRMLHDKSFESLTQRLAHVEALLQEITSSRHPGTVQAPERAPEGAHLARVDGVPPFFIKTHPYENDEYISREIILHGTWEKFETEIVRRLLQHFDLFIDLGANIGWYSAVAQNVMRPSSTIYAFEPDARNFALLCENVRRNERVRAIPVAAAVSDQVGAAQLFYSPTNMGDHQLYHSGDGRQSQEVPVTTLAAFFDSQALRPALVKMDTQGSEPRIFRGGGDILSPGARQSAFIVEFWPYGITNSGESVSDFVDHLSTYPHQPFTIDHPHNRLIPTSWDELKQRIATDLAPATQAFVDLVLVTPGTPAFLAVADLIQKPRC